MHNASKVRKGIDFIYCRVFLAKDLSFKRCCVIRLSVRVDCTIEEEHTMSYSPGESILMVIPLRPGSIDARCTWYQPLEGRRAFLGRMYNGI